MALRGDRLKKWRSRREYTQEELAELIGVGPSQLNRYENEKTDPASDVLARLSHTLGVTADYLLGLTDDPAGHLTEEDLSPMERKLITALRQGLIVEALETMTTLSKGTDESEVASREPAVNR